MASPMLSAFTLSRNAFNRTFWHLGCALNERCERAKNRAWKIDFNGMRSAQDDASAFAATGGDKLAHCGGRSVLSTPDRKAAERSSPVNVSASVPSRYRGRGRAASRTSAPRWHRANPSFDDAAASAESSWVNYPVPAHVILSLCVRNSNVGSDVRPPSIGG